MYNRDNSLNLESIKSVEMETWKLAVKNNTKVGKLDWQVGAALCGRLDVLKWALESGYTPWDWGDKFLLNVRHLDILKWAHENGCPWHELTSRVAVEYGHLDILKWINENDFPWRLSTCRVAAEYCLLYTSPSPRDRTRSRMPSSA